MPVAASLAESFLNFASPVTAKSAPPLLSFAASSFHRRKPKDLMRSLRRFSATGERCAGAAGSLSALLAVMATEMPGSPLLRMNSMRSSADIWLSDFCTSRTRTVARVVSDMRPSLPSCGGCSSSTAWMKVPLFASSLSRTRA